MKKRTTSVILLSPVFILVFIYGLLISPLGGPTLRIVANNSIDGLHIEDIEGSFSDHLTFTNISWKNEQWNITIGNAYLNARWRCAFEPRVCVDDIRINHAKLAQLSEMPASDTSEQPQSTVTLPLPITIERALIEDFSLVMPGQSINLSTLSISAFNASDSVDVDSISMSDLVVSLANVEPPSAAINKALPKSYSLSYRAPELPTIASPIPVNIAEFELTNATLNQAESSHTLTSVAIQDFNFNHTELSLSALDVVDKSGEVHADIAATLEGEYPLDVTLIATGMIDGSSQRVNLDASGSLGALNAQINSDGAVNANVNLSVNLLSDTLPISFDANWQEQPLISTQSGILHAGQLSLNGTMGDYVLTGNGATTLPDTGKIPVAVNVILKRHNIYVTEATIDLFEGSISNTGTLYLDQAVSWEGNTKFTNISADIYSDFAPKQLQGGFTSIMQWSEKGLQTSIRDLALTGTLQDKPLSVSGALVYSGPSDLMVASLDVTQQDNQINLVGQVFNNRYINADLNLNVASVSDLYPDVSGAISGTIKATGPWKNPNAKGSIFLHNILVSPALSSDLAQQGEINATVSVDGAYTAHKLDVDVSLPQHNLALSMAGKWQDNAWTGQINNSQMTLANTHWSLLSALPLHINSTPLSVNVGDHCWHSREQGKLCVNHVEYQQNKANWSMQAKSLPVGLWAHELAPDIIAEAAPATLSLQSEGQYSANDRIDATFTASLSPATWKFGSETPLAININAVNTTGQLKQGELTSTSLITSDDLGQATLALTTRPFESRIPLNGDLKMTNIDVAPLKPLSRTIRTLTGLLNGNIAVAGYLDAPELTGKLNINNGAIDIQDTPVTLQNWSQTITLNGKTADFAGQFILGGGEGSLTGDINWSDTPSANINLKGEKFEVRQPNMRLRVSPDLNIAATSQRIDVTGSMNIPWAKIEIDSLPKSAVSPSKDVHLRGEPIREEPLDIVHASVMVNIDKAKTGDVKLDAFGLTASLHGGIQVNTQPAIVGYGDLQILNGRYNAYGQQLVIQTGEVQFNGPIDQPLLLVEAIRDPDKTDDDVIAGIRIDGAADSPSINLFSEPAMDQQNVLSYLLTGQGPQTESEDPNYAALLVGFGLSNTKTLTGQVGKVLGIDDFTLSTNENKLSVTGQINERLSAQYNVDVGLSNNDASSTLRRRQDPPDLSLKYRLLPRLFLEAIQTTIEDQSEFAIDLYYEFFLGEPNNDTEEDDEQDETQQP